MPPSKLTGARPMKITKEQRNHAIKRIFAYEIKYYPFEFFMSIFCVIGSCISSVMSNWFVGMVFVNEILTPLKDGTMTGEEVMQKMGMWAIIMGSVYVFGIVCIYFYNFLMCTCPRVKCSAKNYNLHHKPLRTKSFPVFRIFE